MVVVYESKTGFTRKYAEMLSTKTGYRALPVKEIAAADKDEEIIFLGWIKAGKIQGLNKVRKFNLKAVCATGTARSPEPSAEALIARNRIKNVPFFYLRGGCLPLKELKGMDRILMIMFVSALKLIKNKDEETEEKIAFIENGYDGVKEENLEPVIRFLMTGKG